jgi:hypothetical protein
MKSAVILALTSTTLAGMSKSTLKQPPLHILTTTAPFGDYLDAIFGTNQARHEHHPHHMPGFPPMGTGAGNPFPLPFPTASGAFPAASGGMHHMPGHHRHHYLAMDYQLASTAVPEVKRQESELPSFSLVDSAMPVPTGTEGAGSTIPTAPAFPLPTETAGLPFPTGGFPGLPSGTDEPSPLLPTGGFPAPTGEPELPFPTEAPNAPFPFPMPTGGFPGGTGMPSLPTTLQTLTRGPQATAAPSFPGEDGGENGNEQGSGGFQGWLDWLEGLFGGATDQSA